MKSLLPPVGCRPGFTRDRRISIARNGDQTNERITTARPMRSHSGQPLALGGVEGSGMGKGKGYVPMVGRPAGRGSLINPVGWR